MTRLRRAPQPAAQVHLFVGHVVIEDGLAPSQRGAFGACLEDALRQTALSLCIGSPPGSGGGPDAQRIAAILSHDLGQALQEPAAQRGAPAAPQGRYR